MYIAVVSDQLGIEISLPVAWTTSDIAAGWPTKLYIHALDYLLIQEIWCATFFYKYTSSPIIHYY